MIDGVDRVAAEAEIKFPPGGFYRQTSAALRGLVRFRIFWQVGDYKWTAI